MHPRLLTARIVQRTSKALVVAALALGLSAVVMAPASAFAAPLNPAKGPSYGPDLTVSLPRTAHVGIGERALIPLEVKNIGSTGAGPVKVKLVHGIGFDNVAVAGTGFSCTYDGLVGLAQYGYTCTASRIEGGSGMTLAFTGDDIDDDLDWLEATVDPQNAVREANERNNGLYFNF